MIDGVFDPSAWNITDPEEELWVIQTRENTTLAAPHASSSACFVQKNTPVVRLRWTDQDFVALAAD
jgi:hypothetical protein